MTKKEDTIDFGDYGEAKISELEEEVQNVYAIEMGTMGSEVKQ